MYDFVYELRHLDRRRNFANQFLSKVTLFLFGKSYFFFQGASSSEPFEYM